MKVKVVNAPITARHTAILPRLYEKHSEPLGSEFSGDRRAGCVHHVEDPRFGRFHSEQTLRLWAILRKLTGATQQVSGHSMHKYFDTCQYNPKETIPNNFTHIQTVLRIQTLERKKNR
jgi:hypothetical protein